MILKIDKFVTQWRKFESKKSYIFKDIDLWFFWIFWEFIFIFKDFNSFKNRQKRDLFFARTAGWRGAARDPREWDMACKARGSAAWTHVTACIARRWHGGGTDPSPRGHMSSLGDVPGAHAFWNSVWGGAGAVRGAPTEFRADRRSFGGLIGGFEKSCLRRFGGYRQNFHLKWPSMWCSDWAEILCGNISRREEHAQKVLRDLHERHRRCFRTRDVSWARPWMFVGHLAHCGTVGGDPSGTWARRSRVFLGKFCMVGAGVEWGPHTKFQANRRWFEGWSGVSKKIAKVWRLPAELPIEMVVDVVLQLGWNLAWERFLARGTSPQSFARFAPTVWEMLQNQGRVMGASCTFVGHLACCGTIGGGGGGGGGPLGHEQDALVRF